LEVKRTEDDSVKNEQCWSDGSVKKLS